jgi:hypothetical protein
MNWEEQLGIKLTALVGGLVGGIISLTFEEKLSFTRAVALIFTGGVTAGYSFVAVESYFHLSPSLAGVFGFSIGLISMRLVKAILNLASLVSSNPIALTSRAEFLKALKNNGNTHPDSSSIIDNQPDIHPSGEGDKDVRE